ncbi:uncharacterized protein LOC6619446 isoform X7 [Drosophila sechellia]|uniref:uncharacterized protein LOC6619446 isoform X7 n=1 Tax=Drosophila sechellia TaxID=7238 RepID=UPI0013DE0C30|nr:uncharacterized protein LOC6619446 isoform X7 [Drosophila sechellia]
MFRSNLRSKESDYSDSDKKKNHNENLEILTASLKISVAEQSHISLKEPIKKQEPTTSYQQFSRSSLPTSTSDVGVKTLRTDAAELENKMKILTSNIHKQDIPIKTTYKRQNLISSSRRINQEP